MGSIMPFACLMDDFDNHNIAEFTDTTTARIEESGSGHKAAGCPPRIKGNLNEMIELLSPLEELSRLQQIAERLSANDDPRLGEMIQGFELIGEVNEVKEKFENSMPNLNTIKKELATSMSAYQSDLHCRIPGLKIEDEESYYLTEEDKEKLKVEVGQLTESYMRRSMKFNQYAESCSKLAHISAELKGNMEVLEILGK